MPNFNDAIEKIHSRHGAGDASPKAVDEQDAAATLEDFGLTVGGITQGGQVGPKRDGFGFE